MDKHIIKSEKKNIKQAFKRLIKYYGKKFFHFTAALLIFALSLLFLYPELNRRLNQVFKEDLGNSIFPNFDKTFFSYIIKIIVGIVLIIIAILISYGIKKIFIPNKGKQRNAELLIDNMRSDNNRTPCVSKEDLKNRILGRDPEPKIEMEINNIIDSNTTPIKNFILNNEKILLVSGKWGSGKTTYTLTAINELLDSDDFKNTDYRFIYESSFKYISEFGEFRKDILKVIRSILSEQNIFKPLDFTELINNISSSKFGIVLSNFKASKTTTDIISSLNRKYRRKCKNAKNRPFKITIIIDDIDRLQGEEIIYTLAFLSILRRLDFIKIIIPIDRNVVIDQLKKSGVTEPQIYINKYLPEQSSIDIISNYDAINNILFNKIYEKVGSSYSYDQVWAIVECVYLKAFSNRLKENMRALNIDNLGGGWPTYKYSSLPKELLENNDYNSKYIFDAYNSLRNGIVGAGGNNDLNTTRHIGTADNFESIIYLLHFKDKRPTINESCPLRVDAELYEKCIRSWVMRYTEIVWDKLGLTIREINDMCEKYMPKIVKSTNAAMQTHSIFVNSYNAFFPRWPITDEMITDTNTN